MKLFKKNHIENLKPLRLEENVRYIKESNIAIVGEVLSIYQNNHIAVKNLNLESKINRSKIKKYEAILINILM